MSWREYAACRGQDPELFFPVGTVRSAAEQLEQAKRVCAGCAVRSVCLQWAILSDTEHGVWGGMAEDERKALKPRDIRTTTQSLRLGQAHGTWLSGPAPGWSRQGGDSRESAPE